jgi:hypothetical protein
LGRKCYGETGINLHSNARGNTAYIEPYILRSKVSEEILYHWEATKCTLDEWGHKFLFVDQSEHPISLSVLEQEVENIKKAIVMGSNAIFKV